VQAEALGMARSTVYALPRPVSDRDLDLMKRIDRLHLEMPYAGSRMLRDLLNQDGIKVRPASGGVWMTLPGPEHVWNTEDNKGEKLSDVRSLL
jgi:putative transposase